MKYIPLLILIFIACPSTIYASEHRPNDLANHEWTIGVSAGITTIKRAEEQTFGNVSISKELGNSFVGMDLSFVDSGEVAGLIANIPASTKQITLSGGTSFDALNIDGYISLGKRSFDLEAVSRNGRQVNIDSGGEAFGTGISLSYDFVATSQLFITPTISLDYNELDIARLANLPDGQQTGIENNENGVTGSVGVAIQKLFGSEDAHLVSLIANFVTTSNTTSFNPGSNQYPVLRALAQREETGQKDSWGEAGGSISIQLSDSVRWDTSVIQTLGFLDADATSFSSGFRFSF